LEKTLKRKETDKKVEGQKISAAMLELLEQHALQQRTAQPATRQQDSSLS